MDFSGLSPSSSASPGLPRLTPPSTSSPSRSSSRSRYCRFTTPDSSLDSRLLRGSLAVKCAKRSSSSASRVDKPEKLNAPLTKSERSRPVSDDALPFRERRSHVWYGELQWGGKGIARAPSHAISHTRTHNPHSISPISFF